MRLRTKVCAVSAPVFLACLLALIPQAAATPSITLSTTSQAPEGSVTVTGTGFGAARNIGIAFGAESNVTGEIVNQVVTGDMRDYNFTRRPIKPGSIQIIHLNLLTGSAPLVTDDGAGTLYLGTSGNIFSNAMNYALGNYHREGVVGTNPADYLLTASYISYQYSLTSFGGITTDASGRFSANFTLPVVTNGDYIVTAIDSSGNVATATITAIPEALPFAAIMLLSAIAVAAGSLYLRKQLRIPEYRRWNAHHHSSSCYFWLSVRWCISSKS